MNKEILEIDGLRYSLNHNTGEVKKLCNIEIEEGTKVRIITPEQQEIIKSKEQQKIYKADLYNELGDFYFIMNENKLGNLSPANATRLIYLCTYLNYDNEFMLNNIKEMRKSDIKDLLKISKRSFYNFWNEINPTYIVEDKNKLKLNTKEINKGKTTSKKTSYRKLWIKQVQELYEATPISKHKHLGYVFQLLPFVNIEYNIVCQNQNERILDKIRPLTIKDFCDIIGYNPNQSARLIETYKNITFDFKGEKEYFVSFVTNTGNLDEAKIFINPHVIYSGSNYKNVEILGAFVK